jgi:serine/threonine-protein kinase
MGVVYEAYDPLIKRVVALKTIRSDRLAGEESSSVVARFRREAQAAGRLSHPNIVSIYDFGEDGGVWFIALEFIKGRELKEYFETDERFGIPDIVRIMSQILDALDYSHRQGVIHRDIKPANIFLLENGSVKVADFGIAHIETSNLTQVGTVLGTPSYMSPEQIMGLPVDGRSDLFSAGVILYQFLTGERPFAGSATTTMQKILKEDPLPPTSLNVQAPAAMDAVMRRALAKRPDERFQTAQEFAAAIRAAAQVMTPSAAEATLVGTSAATIIDAADKTLAAGSAAVKPVVPATGQVPVLAPAARSAQPKSQTRALAIVAAIAIVTVGAGIWFTFLRQPGAGGPAQGPRVAGSAGADARSTAHGAARGDTESGPGNVADLRRRTRRSERPAVSG